MANTDAEFRLDYLSDCIEPEQFRPDPVLLFCMNGDLSVTVEGERQTLPANGVLLINPNRRFSLSAGKQSLACRLTIPAAILKRYLAGRAPLFWCNSLQDSREEYDRLRSLLRQFLGAQLRNPEQPAPMALSYFYELLDCLLRTFLTEPDEGQTGKENQEALRLQEVTEYIEENYARHLSLNDLAEHLHLTYSYLSRYLKKALGMNFLEYLNQVRLRHAVEDLLYTDKPITYVAVDNGFVNSSGLNKAFREAYDMTPSAYKAKLRGSRDDRAADDTGREKLYGQLRRYLSEQGETPARQRAQRRTQILANGARQDPYQKNWEETINIGRASDLLKSRVREQLLYLRDTLGFRYVRFWSVLDADMELRARHDTEQLNFDRLDEILDFITGNGMLPYIEFGNKPKTILRNSMEMVMIDEGEPIFHNIPEFQAVLRKFFHHLVTRYRAETVKNWRFECWDDDRYDRQTESVSYFEIFNTVCDTIRSILPEAVIGGCGMKVSDPDMESFLRQWMLQPQRPDFFSVMVYPYEESRQENYYTNYTALSTDPAFMIHWLDRVHSAMEAAGASMPLYVSEWGMSLSSRNYLNDSCYKGCYLLKNIVGSLDKADMIAYWAGSDLISTYFDSPNIINGGPGLLSKDGICKPSYFAYRFLRRMGRYLVEAGKNYLITASGHFSYYIICFNDNALPARYFRADESSHTPVSLRELLGSMPAEHLSFTLENLPAQQYTIKTSVISPQYGSILDEWLRLNTMTNIRKEDIDYLKRICTPHMFIQELAVKDGRISFPVDLDGEEIALIHVYQTP